MVWDPEGKRILLIAGQPEGPVPTGDLWSWDGQSWVELKGGTVTLPPRKNFGAAWDVARKRLVVFGGIYGGLVVTPKYLADTWEWDGASWQERTSAKAPAARAGHGLAYDAKRGRVVLFGGMDASTPFQDTWEWDGTSWVELTPGAPPSARVNTRMTYDSTRQRVVLFGGMTLTGGVLGDLWEWDGQSWIEAWPSSSEPHGRGFHALAHDSTHQRLILYGGATKWPPYMNASNIFADHWQWDGAGWKRIGDGAGPGKRSGVSMAFDLERQALVLFGGSDDGTHGKADTWQYR